MKRRKRGRRRSGGGGGKKGENSGRMHVGRRGREEVKRMEMKMEIGRKRRKMRKK